jgi:tetratricopeptide (TPR) repeat protein
MVDRDSEEDLFVAAKRCFESEEFAKASKLLAELLAKETSHTEARRLLGMSLLRRGRHTQALEQLMEAKRLGVQETDLHIPLGKTHLGLAAREKGLPSARQKRLLLAWSAFDSAVNAQPTPIDACIEAGQACAEEGEHDRALAYFETATQADPNASKVHLAAGEAAMGMAKYDRALTYFEASIKIEPGSVEAHLGAGRACVEMAKRDKAFYGKALAHLEDALKLAPDSDEPYDVLKEALSESPDQDTALRRLCEIARRQLHFDGRLRLAALLWSLDKPAMAFKQLLLAACSLDSSIPTLSDRPALRQFWFVWRKRAGSTACPPSIMAKAKSSLDEARDARAYALWACGLSRARLETAALDYWQRALELAPADPDCHALMRVAYRRVHRRGSQVKPEPTNNLTTTIQSVIDRSGEPLAHLQWGDTLSTLGHRDAAKLEFERNSQADRAAELAARFATDDAHALMWTHRDALSETVFRSSNPCALVAAIDRLMETSTRPDLLYWWCTQLARIGQPKVALPRFKAALACGDTDADNTQLPEAASSLTTAVKNDPILLKDWISLVEASRNSAAHEKLAEVLVELERYQDALACCKAWTEIAPEHAEAFHKLGEVYSKKGKLDEAIAAFKDEIALAPGETQGYASYLQAMKDRDTKSGVVSEFLDVFSKWGKGIDAAVNWQEVERLKEKDAHDAAELRGWSEMYIDRAEDHASHAEALRVLGMEHEALRLLQQSYKLLGNQASEIFFYRWGALLQSAGNYRAAIVKYKRAIALNPALYYPYAACTQCHEGLMQLELASRACARTLAKATDFGEDETAIKVGLYSDWARILNSARKYDESLQKVQIGLELKPRDYWCLFQRAYTLADMEQSDLAIVEYERATRSETLPHAHNNIADIFEQQGRYREAKQKLDEVRKIYQNGLADRLRDRDAYYCVYYSYAWSFGPHDRKAEDLLRAAITFDSDNIDAHLALEKLYLDRAKAEAAQQASANDGRTNIDRAATVPARFDAVDYYRRSERLLSRQLRACRTVDTLLRLGELHQLNGESEKAKTAFDEAVVRDPDSLSARKGLAEACVGLSDFPAAVRSLRIAAERSPKNISILLLHAHACRRAEPLDDVVAKYEKVLAITPFHVDALVGLGELYLDIAEKRASQKVSTGTAELYSKAISSLSKAIDLFDTRDAPYAVASNTASTHYLLGYAQVKLYETSVLRRDRRLVSDALKNFRACLTRDKAHVKAKWAIESIEEDRRAAKNVFERQAGSVVIVMAMTVFALAQFGIFFGRPVQSQGVMLTRLSLESAKAAGMNDDQLSKLKPFESLSFEAGDKLAAQIKESIGNDNFAKFSKPLLEHAERKSGEWMFEKVDLTSYVLLTFGSLLLIIAGAFLPQLTSLKLAGVQLEKVSAERIETKTTFAIEK